jgi:hypothetical protein
MSEEDKESVRNYDETNDDIILAEGNRNQRAVSNNQGASASAVV